MPESLFRLIFQLKVKVALEVKAKDAQYAETFPENRRTNLFFFF